MKRIYMKPSADVVDIKLIGSILDDPNPGVEGWSKYTLEGDAKEQSSFDWEDDASADKPRNVNLWEE